MMLFNHSRMIGKILNFLTITLRDIREDEDEKSRWPCRMED